MEDENGIELSLGLSCGGSTSKSKVKDGSTDFKAAEGNRNRSMGENFNVSEVSFKPFSSTSIENLDCNGQRRNDPVKQQRENFWTNLGQCTSMEAEGTRYRELWVSNNNVPDVEEEKSGLNKRKLSFEETNTRKKHERGVDRVGLRGKSPTAVTLKSHVSVTTEDGSSGENEDGAESEAEGSTSLLVSKHEKNVKGPDISKGNDKHFLIDSSVISSCLKQSNESGNESNLDCGKSAYGISLQPLPVMSVPYQVPVKVTTVASTPNTSGFPSPCVMQLMPLSNSEQPTVQSMNSGNLQLAFGYSSLQLPMLETNSSWVLGSQPPQHVPAYPGRHLGEGVTNTEHPENDLKISNAAVQAPRNSSSALAYEGNASDMAKVGGKHLEVTGISSSSQTGEEAKGNNTIFRSKEITKQPVLEGFPHEASPIRPGVAPSLKFGGSGSHPDLPWVSTTGPGPNGKTISGVTYKYSVNQIKIVCACHGSHMSPEEFVQHASADAAENNTDLSSFPSNNAAASAQS